MVQAVDLFGEEKMELQDAGSLCLVAPTSLEPHGKAGTIFSRIEVEGRLLRVCALVLCLAVGSRAPVSFQ